MYVGKLLLDQPIVLKDFNHESRIRRVADLRESFSRLAFVSLPHSKGTSNNGIVRYHRHLPQLSLPRRPLGILLTMPWPTSRVGPTNKKGGKKNHRITIEVSLPCSGTSTCRAPSPALPFLLPLADLSFLIPFTFQDLKKQTAMRLAQEQQRQGRYEATGYAANPTSPEVYAPVVEAPRSTPPQVHNLATPPINSHAYVNVGVSSSGPRYNTTPENVVGTSGTPAFEARGVQTPVSWASARARKEAPTKQKTKLPHGLTVQELKEMTKARLQQEAADMGEGNRVLRTPEPTSVPAEPRTAPPQTPPYRENWTTDRRKETWDTPASTVASANQSPFANTDFQGGFAYNRVRSFTDSQRLERNITPPGPQGYVEVPPFYDHSVGFTQNRRRAQTLSPRLGLSHVQEEYPIDSEIPLSPMSRPPAAHIHGRGTITDPGLEGHAKFENLNSSFGYSSAPNRPRTSSAVSLPPISHTADEFGLEPSHRGVSPFGTVCEENVTPGLSDVFRGNRLSPVPVTSSVMNEIGLYSDNRTRAATWSDSLMSSAIEPEELSDDLASLLKLVGPDA